MRDGVSNRQVGHAARKIAPRNAFDGGQKETDEPVFKRKKEKASKERNECQRVKEIVKDRKTEKLKRPTAIPKSE